MNDMMIDKPYAIGDIISFKLPAGEEMIARFVSETPTHFKITKPVSLVPTPSGSYGMVPAIVTAELNTVNIAKASVIIHTPTKKDVAEQYRNSTSSIVQASMVTG